MHTIYLFPHALKRIGWVLLIPGLVLGVLCLYFNIQLPFLDTDTKKVSGMFDLTDGNFTNELAGILLMAGLMFIAFSRRKQEDELIAHMRLDALLWAVYANSAALVICLLLIYGGDFFSVLIYNMYTVPVIYLLRFQYLLYRASKINAPSV